MESPNLFSPDLMVENILYLDGLTRAGKFLLGKTVSNLKRVEYFQFQKIIENLPAFNYLGIMSEADAVAYLRICLNMYIYERAIGRNMNLRTSDGSCVLNSSEYHVLEERISKTDGMEAIEIFKAQRRYPAFLTHECMPHIDFLFKATPQMKMINIRRHPVDVISSWYIRGWGERFGKDPLAFDPCINSDGEPAPWFGRDWQHNYIKMSPVDRTIKSVNTLYCLDKEAFKSFSKKGEQILIIAYEDFCSRPNHVIDQMKQFLNTDSFSNMDEVLAREGCPREIPLDSRREKFTKLKQNAGDSLIEELVEISREYEKTWNLKPFI